MRNVLQTLHAGVTLTVYYANGSVITALVIFILPQNTWGLVVIYCVEGLDKKLSDSFHFGWDEGNTMRRNRGDVLWQTVDENHFLLHGCITSAEQRERVVVRGMGVVWHYGIYGIWNYLNPDLDREIIQRINLQLHCWFVVNWYDKLIDILHVLFYISNSSSCFQNPQNPQLKTSSVHLWHLFSVTFKKNLVSSKKYICTYFYFYNVSFSAQDIFFACFLNV